MQSPAKRPPHPNDFQVLLFWAPQPIGGTKPQDPQEAHGDGCQEEVPPEMGGPQMAAGILT